MNNFSPRFGVAYRINDKTVIRTGGGIFLRQYMGHGNGLCVIRIVRFCEHDQHRAVERYDPHDVSEQSVSHRLVAPTGSSLGPATLLGQAITFGDRGNRTPYGASWNFNIQRELPAGVLLEVGYLGSRGVKFPSARSPWTSSHQPTCLGHWPQHAVPNPFSGRFRPASTPPRQSSGHNCFALPAI